MKNWGSGEPADLGELQVESFSQDLFSDHSKPFYEQLARRLEELQVTGCLFAHELLMLQLCPAYFAIYLACNGLDCWRCFCIGSYAV